MAMTPTAYSQTFTYLWGKLCKPPPQEIADYHPLICHMIDTAMVAEVLWDEVLTDSFKREIVSFFASEDRARGTVALLAALHDLGKAAPVFAARWKSIIGILRRMGYDFPPVVDGKTPHGQITAKCLYEELKTRGVVRLFGGQIAHVLGGHHGIFIRIDETKRLSSYDLGNERWRESRSALLTTLEELLGAKLCPDSLNRLGESKSSLIKLAGLTSVADWIASSERYFPYAISGPSELEAFELSSYLESARSRARQALSELGWLGWRPDGWRKSFAEMFGFKELRPLQRTAVAIADREPRDPILVLIEAPMGEGKTEAAFFLQDRLQVTAGQRGMYLALPTQATSNQMFERTASFLQTRYPRERINLHLLHGQAGLDERYLELRLACEDETVEEDRGRVVAEEWFTPKKRGLLAPFAVGTIDQALLSVLQVRHGFVRLFGLSGKVVIIDEVHSYDVYTSTLLDRLIEWLSALGSSVLLLSATLPRRRREELLRKYGAAGNTLPECCYPRITWLTHGGEPESIHIEARKQGPFKIRRVGPDRRAVAEELITLIANHGGCAAWICNTVGKAQLVYDLLDPLCREAGIKLSLLHARFPFAERQKREEEVLDDFGKGSLKAEDDPAYRKRPEKAILVATQIVEQSLDLDFDLMISDLAPIDLLLQRLGRLHRHEGRKRPDAFADPMLWLVQPEFDSKGLPDLGVDAKVYQRYILLRSWLVVQHLEIIKVPEDIEDLIEAVYGAEGVIEEDQDLPEEWRIGLQEAWDEAQNELANDKKEALVKVIKSPDSHFNLTDCYHADLKEDDPEASLRVQAATRLCRPSVPLVCLYDAGGGKVSLDPEGTKILDQEKEPDLETTRALLGRAVTVTHQGVVWHFHEEKPPIGWRRSPHLRYHRPAVFKNGRCRAGGWEIELNPDLGIRIYKGTEVDQED